MTNYVVAGEKEMTQTFDGGVHSNTEDEDMGDAVLDEGRDGTADDTYMFDLKDGAVARDRQNNNQDGVGENDWDQMISSAWW